MTRPAIALERLSLNRRGEVLLALKRSFRDGTTHLRFTPEDFMARLAALVPRPRANLTRYHGVFAPAHPWRSLVTGTRRESAILGSDRGIATCTGRTARHCRHEHHHVVRWQTTISRLNSLDRRRRR